MASSSPRQSPPQPDLRSLLSSSSSSSSSPAAITATCHSIQSLLHRQSPELTRDFFRHSFPLLLQKLFGFQDCHSHPPSASLSAHSGGWLSQFSPPFNEPAAQALISLLSPSSVLFSLLLRVDKESSVRFFFPTERLPDWVQRLLRLPKGDLILPQVSKLFRDRIKVDASGGLQVQLDVFEYFVFWFAYYAVCKDSSSHQLSFSSKRDRSLLKSMQKRSLQRWVSGLSHNGTSDYPLNPYLQLLQLYLDHFVPALYSTRSKSGTSKPSHAEYSTIDSSRAEFLVHTLVEFWLIDDDPLPLSLAVRQSMGLPILGSAGRTYVIPGSELTDAMRVFVGHMNNLCAVSLLEPSMSWTAAHTSASGANLRRPSFHALSFLTGSNFRHNTYAQTLQRPLYRFIARAVCFWPAGSPVKKAICIVDIWLDYMKPWDSPSSGRLEQQLSEASSAKGPMQSTNYCLYSERWQNFVAANYLFYTTLVVHFLEFALKFLHLDPETVLQMTCKILDVLAGSSDLLECLRKVDAIYGNVYFGRSQHSNDIVSAIQDQLQDWEECLNADCNRDGDMLSRQSRTSQLQFFSVSGNGGQQILSMLILQAEAEIQTVSHASLASCSKALEAIKKAGQIIFYSHPISNPAARPSMESQQIPYPPVASRAFPQHKWSDVKYRGDWMKRPIESTEVAWLVRYLVRLSDTINTRLDLMPNCEAAPQEKHEPKERANANMMMGQVSNGVTHALNKFPSLVLKLLRSSWLIVDQYIRSRGWRVNLRFLAKKPIVVAIFFLVAYFGNSLIVFQRSFISSYLSG